MSQHQHSHRTAYDRYPLVFEVASRSVNSFLPPARRKILSYGCSTGEEARCLADIYFPESLVIGVDISEAVLAIAKANFGGDRIIFDISLPKNLMLHGPFDCITAMSVLCRWPDTENRENISDIYTFDKFLSAVELLDINLRVEGVLVIFNSNFNFLDTDISRRYEVIKIDEKQHNGFAHRFDIKNNRIHDYRENDCIYRKKSDIF